MNLYMIGDSLKSDIYGGNQNGFTSILVKTGNYKSGDLISENEKPDYIVEDVKDAVKKILELN